MGKTSLAVRAAYDAPPDAFDKIVFVSLKSRELDDDGVRDLSGFLISGLAELLNELARELGHAAITKATADQRPRLLLDALRGTRTLLVLDNLESLLKPERDVVFTFVKRLPFGCKAILTSRQRIGSAAEELILEELSESAALATLTKLAASNPALAKTRKKEHLALYRETGGNPLLLRWTAGQIGRGSCVTLTDAIAYLRSCPEGNDPLEFIFGDLVEDFSKAETHVLCMLTYFTLPAKVDHVAEACEFSGAVTNRALRSLTNRSVVVPSEEMKTFMLVPLVADFLRKKKPEVVAVTGEQLEKHAYALIVENGYEKHDRFPVLETAWPTVAATLPRFVAGTNAQLQEVCSALFEFLNFTGRWDEWLALYRDAERCAIVARDFANAGWRAYHLGCALSLRGDAKSVFDCANRAETHWRDAQAESREQAFAIYLRGIGYELLKDFPAAIAAYDEAVKLWRKLSRKSEDVATGLNALAAAEQQAGDLDGAERHYREGLEIVKAIHFPEGIAAFVGNLAALMLTRKDFSSAEILTREALSVSEKIGRQELIAGHCDNLAKALILQGKKSEALPYIQRAVNIFARLDSPEVIGARKTLAMCKS